MSKRTAAVFVGAKKPLEITSFEAVAPAPGTALIKLAYSGVCGTDVHIHEGRLGMPDFPLIIGHEFTGTIEALGSEGCDGLGQPLAVGDRVIACVAVACGKCVNCRKGETASCLAFGVTYVKPASEAPHLHGGFAEALYSPLVNLVKIPAGVNPAAVAAFPCGGPTVIRAYAYGGGVEAGELVVVQGNGSLGLFALAWAKAHGCRTVVIGASDNAQRLEIMNALKPDLFLDFMKTTAEERKLAVLELAKKFDRGDGADVVVEVSGAATAVPEGLGLLRTRGRYFIPGQYSNRGTVAIEPHMITFRALRLIGSGQYTLEDIRTYMEFLAQHPELQELFARCVNTYCVADANQALADAAAGKTIKAAFVLK